MSDRPDRAVTVLSGFLGSGKTTLLRRYLAENGAAGVAVIINEYGTVGVDHHLLRTVEDHPVLLQGGCVCCTRREDLVRTLRDLLDGESSGAVPPIRQVVIETSGIADPVPILFTLATDPMLRHHFAPASVVVTLDALNAAAQIDRQPEVRKQIAAADQVVVTKADLAEDAFGWQTVSRCRVDVRRLNPHAAIGVSRHGDGFSVLSPAASRRRARPADTDPLRGFGSAAVAPLELPHMDVQSTTLGFSGPLDWPAFGVWLGMLLQAHGPDVLRIKGLLDVGDAGPVAVNTAQHVVHQPEHLRDWPTGESRSYLVFIARAIDTARIRESLEVFQRAGGRGDLSIGVLTGAAEA